MKILVFTDLHYFGGDMIRFASTKKLVQYAEPYLDRFIRIAKQEEIAFAVNLGDIIQDTNDKDPDLACLSKMFRRLEEFPCPVYSEASRFFIIRKKCVHSAEKRSSALSVHTENRLCSRYIHTCLLYCMCISQNCLYQ